MKKKFKRESLLVFFLCLGSFVWAQISFNNTEKNMLDNIKNSYESHDYLRVIESSDAFISKYPLSLSLDTVMSYKGECLYLMESYDDCVLVLENKKKSFSKTELPDKDYYYLGMSYFYLNEFDNSLKAFSNIKQESEFFSKTVLACGNIYYSLKKYSDAVDFYLYVINNGNKYDYYTYYLVLNNLYLCFEYTLKYDDLIKLTNRLSDNYDSLPGKVVQFVNLKTGDAYNYNKNYSKAYDCYIEAIEGSEITFSKIAIQKSYEVAVNHPEEVKQNPAELFINLTDNISDDSLLAEFWTRLGLDAYNKGDFTNAISYFYNAIEYENNYYSKLSYLYVIELQSIIMDASDFEKARFALLKLDEVIKQYKIDRVSDFYSDYQSKLLKWNGVLNNNDKVISLYKTSNQTSEDKYYCGLAYYNKKEYKNCDEVLKTENMIVSKNESELSYLIQILYTKNLLQMGKDKLSLEMFKQLYDAGVLKDKDREDYALCLLYNGYLSASYNVIQETNSPISKYISSLVMFNMRKWDDCAKFCNDYLKTEDESYASNVTFFLGYSLNKLGETKKAYSVMREYVNSFPKASFIWNANVIAANCAHQLGLENEAIAYAYSAIDSSGNEEQKETSLFLCSNIYADMNNFNSAINVLLDSAKGKNELGIKSRFQIAQLYGRKGDLTNSDKMYLEIVKSFSNSSYADEACYRRGELFYSAGKYDLAVNRFSDYLVRYPNGKYVDNAYYYEAESYVQQTLYENAVLDYLVIVNTRKNSDYDYSSKKNLIDVYRTIGKYQEALNMCDIILVQYKEQSEKDGLVTVCSQIKRMLNGADEQLVSLQDDYYAAGKNKSLNGRIKGTDLVVYMYKNPSLQKQAFELAKEIVSIQVQEDNIAQECGFALKNIMIMAMYSRKINDNKSAGNFYLDAASYAIMSGDEQTAERALYSAVEAFDAGSLRTDAKNTAKLLNEKYPNSVYSVQAMELIGRK